MRCDTLTPVAVPEHGARLCPLQAWDATASAPSSLANRCLQATGSGGGGCHFGSIDTPARPPVGGTVETRRMGEGGGFVLGGWRPDYEWMDESERFSRQTWQTSDRLPECSGGKIPPASVVAIQTNFYQEIRFPVEFIKHYTKTK